MALLLVSLDGAAPALALDTLRAVLRLPCALCGAAGPHGRLGYEDGGHTAVCPDCEAQLRKYLAHHDPDVDHSPLPSRR